jgi:hypothetical protein
VTPASAHLLPRLHQLRLNNNSNNPDFDDTFRTHSDTEPAQTQTLSWTSTGPPLRALSNLNDHGMKSVRLRLSHVFSRVSLRRDGHRHGRCVSSAFLSVCFLFTWAGGVEISLGFSLMARNPACIGLGAFCSLALPASQPTGLLENGPWGRPLRVVRARTPPGLADRQPCLSQRRRATGRRLVALGMAV